MLPAASQFEKWECTFFNLEFPRNVFHLRPPLFEPMPGTLPESEIHARLCRALGAYSDDDLGAAARGGAPVGRAAYAEAFFALGVARPELGKLAAGDPVRDARPDTRARPMAIAAAGAAAVWGLAQRCALAYSDSIRRAGIDERRGCRSARRCSMRSSPARHGVTFTVDDYDETMRRLETTDGKVSLAIPALLDEFGGARRRAGGVPPATPTFPLVLSAGERRSSTANTI